VTSAVPVLCFSCAASMDISGDWSTWTPSAPIEIQRSTITEGANLPTRTWEVILWNHLRDPAIYQAGQVILTVFHCR